MSFWKNSGEKSRKQVCYGSSHRSSNKPRTMADTEVENTAEEELLDYDEEVQEAAADGAAGDAADAKKDVKGTYVSIHSSGFRDFLLKPELLRAIVDCGFEHPSEGG